MIEKGTVRKVNGNEAVISFIPSDHCASCSGGCGAKGAEMYMRVKVDEEVAPGDIVTVEVSSRALLSSGFMVFILPLIMFIIGAIVASPIFDRMEIGMKSSTAGILVGFGLMILTFALVFVFERKSSRVSALSPRIVSIEKRGPEPSDTNEDFQERRDR